MKTGLIAGPGLRGSGLLPGLDQAGRDAATALAAYKAAVLSPRRGGLPAELDSTFLDSTFLDNACLDNAYLMHVPHGDIRTLRLQRRHAALPESR